MTEQEFAQKLHAAWELREQSYVPGMGYSLGYAEACDAVGFGRWVIIASILLETGYADVWDWCDQVLGEQS